MDLENENGSTANKGKPSPVAIKFMRHEEHYIHEIERRHSHDLLDKYVIRIIRSHTHKDENYDASNIKDASCFPYCIVLPAADRSLRSILDSERIAGKNYE